MQSVLRVCRGRREGSARKSYNTVNRATSIRCVDKYETKWIESREGCYTYSLWCFSFPLVFEKKTSVYRGIEFEKCTHRIKISHWLLPNTLASSHTLSVSLRDTTLIHSLLSVVIQCLSPRTGSEVFNWKHSCIEFS